MLTAQPESNSLNRPTLAKTLRYAIRAIWDHLGLICAASLTWFISIVPLFMFVNRLGSAGGLQLTATTLLVCAWLAFVTFPVNTGIYLLALNIIERDDPSFSAIVTGFRSLYQPASKLGATRTAVYAIFLVNVIFYWMRHTLLSASFSILLIYGLLFWGMLSIYMLPIFVVNSRKMSLDGQTKLPGTLNIIRESLIMFLMAPGYTIVLAFVLAAISIPLFISGAGLALLLPGIVAVISMQATRDHFVALGQLEPLPEIDSPVEDSPWRQTL